MAQNIYTKIIITLAGILLVMAACTGGSQVEVSAGVVEPTPTLVVVGSTIDKPVPYGYDIILKNIVLSINEIKRSANDGIAQNNAALPAPASDQEYLLVRITNQCIATESSTCFVGHTEFQLVDLEGNLINPVSEISGTDSFYTFEEFPRGTSNRGFLAFLVEKNVDYPILTYNSFHRGIVYLSLAY